MQPRRRFSVACLQTNLRDDMAANIAQVSALARQAKAAGAELIATPENSGFMGRNAAASLAAGRSEAEHPALAAYRDLAREMETWLLVGSLAVREDGANRNANRSYLLGPDGEIKARYDKIHLFDVDLPSGETYRESNSIAGGDAAVLTPTPFGALGMTVCYDLRFRISIAAWRKPARNCSAFPPPSPAPPAKRIGMCCCAPAPSKPALS